MPEIWKDKIIETWGGGWGGNIQMQNEEKRESMSCHMQAFWLTWQTARPKFEKHRKQTNKSSLQKVLKKFHNYFQVK